MQPRAGIGLPSALRGGAAATSAEAAAATPLRVDHVVVLLLREFLGAKKLARTLETLNAELVGNCPLSLRRRGASPTPLARRATRRRQPSARTCAACWGS
jgi:hypothetical protein